MIDSAERERLRILQAYDILDTEFEEQYDNIVALASAILQVPTALISLIDQDRQWFKSVIGLDSRETSLDISFCKTMIPTRQPLVVTNAETDERFRDNGAVTSDPHMRFYAGVPIQAREGVVLGALCGIDYKPREISEEQMKALRILGQQVADQLELRRTTRELKDALDQVVVAQKAREQFFAGISHDIRTPAIGILGASQLLQKHQLDAEEARLLGGIEANGKMLLHLLNNLLDLAKMESGGLELEQSIVDLSSIAREAVNAQEPQARAKGLELNLENGLTHQHYLGDPLRISQILWNLVANAIKFTHAGSVTVRLANSPEQVRIEVEDTGVGISAENLEKIFKPFAQEDSSVHRHFGGTGLGLSIVKQLSEAMGGCVTVQSVHGVGTTFKVALSLPQADLNAQATARKVLVVEDNEVNQLVLESMLSDLGVEVQIASCYKEAEEVLKAQTFDAVLLDCELPDGSGLDLARQLRAAHPEARIYGISAHTGPSHKEECLRAGMDGTLAKPFRAEELRLVLSAT